MRTVFGVKDSTGLLVTQEVLSYATRKPSECILFNNVKDAIKLKNMLGEGHNVLSVTKQ